MSGTSNESSKHGRPIKLGGKPMKVASAAKARTTTGKRKRRSIAEILEEMSKYEWNFEAMKRH